MIIHPLLLLENKGRGGAARGGQKPAKRILSFLALWRVRAGKNKSERGSESGIISRAELSPLVGYG